MKYRVINGLNFYDNWIDAQSDRMVVWEGANPVAFPIEFYINELFGELGEAANVIKKLDREYGGAPGSRDTVEHLGEELADGLICVRNLAIKLHFPELLNTRTRVVGTRKYTTLSEYGATLGHYFGNVCMSLHDTAQQTPVHYLGYLQTVLFQTACFVHADLDTAYVRKWNATSEKNGFPHRMWVPGESYALEDTY